jgi:Zn-dependent peptidase ImmA (M78 family)
MSKKNLIITMADELIESQGTTNPEELIKSRESVTFQYTSLTDNVRGLYIYINEENQLLTVDEALKGYDKQFTLFHELGHNILDHRGDVLLSSLSIKGRKEEYDANLFATYMFIRHNNITKENVGDFVLPKTAMLYIDRFLK